MTGGLVSVITGTIPERLDLLLGAMASLREQDYPRLEHCVAVEGEPDAVDAAVRLIEDAARSGPVPTRAVGLGRWWSRFLTASLSAVPFQAAQWLARGDLLMWLADDERMAPDHVSSLVALLDEADADFVSSLTEMSFVPDLGPQPPQTIGAHPPRSGTIANALYRADLLDYRGFTTHVGSGTDWDQVGRWLEAGARHALLERATFRHRADKFGDGDAMRAPRRPLRGRGGRPGRIRV